MPEGEDPIIVKPGVYPGVNQGDSPREGICIVVDDGDTWKFEKVEIIEEKDGKVLKSRIHLSFPGEGKWIVVSDFTPPFPDPPVAEDPPVTRKKKIAILRVDGDFDALIPGDAPGKFTINFTDRNEAPAIAKPKPA